MFLSLKYSLFSATHSSQYASNVSFQSVSGLVVLDGVSERLPEYMVRVAAADGTLENIMFIRSVLIDGVVVGAACS